MKFPVTLLALCSAAAPLLAEQAPQRTELSAEFADFKTQGNESRVICTRGANPVTLVGTNLKITCDRLEIIALGVGDTKSVAPVLEKFRYLLATGQVTIVQGDRVATCGKAEVFPHENKVELTDSPIVIDHGNDVKKTEEVTTNGVTEKKTILDHASDLVWSGEKITMFRGERRVVVEKAHFTGPSIRDLGFDPKKPVPTPASATPPPAPEAAAPVEEKPLPAITVPKK